MRLARWEFSSATEGVSVGGDRGRFVVEQYERRGAERGRGIVVSHRDGWRQGSRRRTLGDTGGGIITRLRRGRCSASAEVPFPYKQSRYRTPRPPASTARPLVAIRFTAGTRQPPLIALCSRLNTLLGHVSILAPVGANVSLILERRKAWSEDLGSRQVDRSRRSRRWQDPRGDETRGYGCGRGQDHRLARND